MLNVCVVTIQTIKTPCSIDNEFEKVDSNHILCKLFYMCQGKITHAFLLHKFKAEEDLPDILEELIPIIPHYYSLGRSLRLHPRQLNEVRKTYLLEKDAEQALNDVLFMWLSKQYDTERFGLPTWRALIEAVAKRLGGNNIALARKMASNHPASKLANVEVTHNYSYALLIGNMPELDGGSNEHRSVTRSVKTKEIEEKRDNVVVHAPPDYDRNTTKPEQVESKNSEVGKNLKLQADAGT